MKRRKNRQEEIPADISENQEEKKPRKRFGRKRKTDQIIRIEELEELMSNTAREQTLRTLSACTFPTVSAVRSEQHFCN